MTAVPTATGTADSSELGRVLVHEHVFVLGEEFRQNYADWDEDVAPTWNYPHISADVLPALLERGLTEDDIDAILVRNPRRYFENGAQSE